MKKILLGLFALAIGASACDSKTTSTTKTDTSNAVTYDTTASGLVYRKLKDGQGRKIEKGEVAIIHLAGYINGGNKEIVNTWESKFPMHIHLGSGQAVDGLDEGITMMHVGDSYEFILTPELGYGNVRMLGIPAHSELLYQVQLLGLKDAGDIVFDTTGIVPELTGSGLEIYWVHRTEGKRAEPGQVVKVHYSGCLTNGRKFDSSYDREAPINVAVAKGQVIPGWDEMLQLMRVGEKAKVVIPYHLAYGELGKKGYIPPKSDLVFDMELLEIESLE